MAVALLFGIWTGQMLMNDLNPAVAFLRAFDTTIVDAVVDREHATVRATLSVQVAESITLLTKDSFLRSGDPLQPAPRRDHWSRAEGWWGVGPSPG